MSYLASDLVLGSAVAPVFGLGIGTPQEIDKYPDPQRQMAPLRENRVDVVARRGKFVQHRDQFAGFDLAADFPHRAPRQSFAGQCPVMQNLAVVADHVAGHLDGDDLAVLPETPAALAAFTADRQAIMLLQVVDSARHAVPLDIGRRGHHDAFVIRELGADQRRVRQRCDTDRDVDPFADQVDHPVVQVQCEGNVAMFGKKGGHERRHVLPPEAGRRRNQQMAAGVGAALGDRRFCIVQVGQDALAILQEGFALVGQCDFARGALQKFHTEAFL